MENFLAVTIYSYVTRSHQQSAARKTVDVSLLFYFFELKETQLGVLWVIVAKTVELMKSITL